MENNWKKPQDYKNKVPMSTHNLSDVRQTTLLQGLNIPIRFDKVRAGDRWHIDMADLLQSDPFLAPVKGMYRLTFSVWYESDFNLYGWMRDNDQQSTEEILTNNRHRFNVPAYVAPANEFMENRMVAVEYSDNGVTYPLPDPNKVSDIDLGEYQGSPVVTRVSLNRAGLLDYRDPLNTGPYVSQGSYWFGGCVGRGGLLDYIGIAPGYQGLPTDEGLFADEDLGRFCADFILTYLDVMRCGMMNTQTRLSDAHPHSYIPIFGNGDVYRALQAGPQTDVSVLDDDVFYPMTSELLDGFFKWLRRQDDGVFFDQNEDLNDGVTFTSWGSSFDDNPHSYGTDLYWKWFFNHVVRMSMYPYGGLCAAQYRPDVYRNLLSVDVGKTKSYVETDASGRFTIDTLRFQNKLQRVIDRYDISGGRISSWLRTLWGVETRRRFTTPELLGVTSHIIDPSTITSLSQTGDIGASESTDVGTMRSNIDRFKEHKQISFVASEPGTLMVLAQLVPIVTYTQNVDPVLRETSFADEYNPEFAQLGFQDVPKSDYSVLPTSQLYDFGNPNSDYTPDFLRHIPALDKDWDISESDGSNPLGEVVGRNIAWVHLMTSANRAYGEFSNLGSRDYWTFQRRYTRYYENTFKYFYPSDYGQDAFVSGITTANLLGAKTQISPYVHPLDFQYPFADQTLLDPHFYLDVAFNVRVVRKIGKRFMPNLERND